MYFCLAFEIYLFIHLLLIDVFMSFIDVFSVVAGPCKSPGDAEEDGSPPSLMIQHLAVIPSASQ